MLPNYLSHNWKFVLWPLSPNSPILLPAFGNHQCILWASLVAQLVNIPPAMWETWVGKIPWRRAWQPTPVFLSGESPWTEEPGGLQSIGLQRVGHDWETRHTMHSLFQWVCFFIDFTYEWDHTLLVFLGQTHFIEHNALSKSVHVIANSRISFIFMAE